MIHLVESHVPEFADQQQATRRPFVFRREPRLEPAPLALTQVAQIINPIIVNTKSALVHPLTTVHIDDLCFFASFVKFVQQQPFPSAGDAPVLIMSSYLSMIGWAFLPGVRRS
jgi:hypothetical protein